jgi:hypothetical protein
VGTVWGKISEGRGHWGAEDEVCGICTYEDSMTNPTKHCLKEGEEGRGDGNIIEGVNVFRVHCTYGTITMKFPHIINVC